MKDSDLLFAQIEQFLRDKKRHEATPSQESSDQRVKAAEAAKRQAAITEKLREFPRGFANTYDSPNGFTINWDYHTTNFEQCSIQTQNTNDSSVPEIELGHYSNEPPYGLEWKCSFATGLGVKTLTYLELTDPKEPTEDGEISPGSNSTIYCFDNEGNHSKIKITRGMHINRTNTSIERVFTHRIDLDTFTGEDFAKVDNALSVFEQMLDAQV